jgi:hypothetical protein
VYAAGASDTQAREAVACRRRTRPRPWAIAIQIIDFLSK